MSKRAWEEAITRKTVRISEYALAQGPGVTGDEEGSEGVWSQGCPREGYEAQT